MFENRIFRCDKSDFYGDEIFCSNKTHTDNSLKAISDAGFNGIWLRGKLRELVPGKLFGPYVEKSNERLIELRHLCERAATYGLGVWLYFTEPLGLPASHQFWNNNRDIAGPADVERINEFEPGAEEALVTLCPSTSKVRDYLSFGFETLFSSTILRGAILITASEQPSHCFSRVIGSPDSNGSWVSICKCPRCGPKGPTTVISDVINIINTAIKSANKDAKVVAWDWAWFLFCKAPYKELIDKLSNDVIVMADFERGGKVYRCGTLKTLQEYSLMYPGPSKWFLKQVKNLGGERPLWTKLQINTTHELATVANIPLVVSLYRKFRCLKKVKAAGFMASWNFGCAAETLNTFAVQRLANDEPLIEEREWLAKLAREFFGNDIEPENILKAWYSFLRACRYYPIGGGCSYLYFGPINYAIGYPLKLSFTDKLLGPGWLRHEFGDRVENSLEEISLSQMIDSLHKFARAWNKAVTIYDKAISDIQINERLQKEIGCAHYVGNSAISAYNIYRWYESRKDRQNAILSKLEIDIIKSEINNCRSALPFIEADNRLGFHGEAQWRMFTPETVKRKIILLESYLT